MDDTKRRRELMTARIFIRHNMVTAAELRHKAALYPGSQSKFLADADAAENSARAMAEKFDLGDPRWV